MIRISSEELQDSIEYKIYQYYLLLGNDFFLLQESQIYIKKILCTQNCYNEFFCFVLDKYIDWDVLFNICKERSLFSKRQVITLILSKINISTVINNKLKDLILLAHKNLLFIIQGDKLTLSLIRNTEWYIVLCARKTIFVNCITPIKENLLLWVKFRAKKMNLILHNDACKLLCYFYENNLLMLMQTLIKLSLIYTDRIISSVRVKNILNSSSNFLPYHWIDSIFEGNSARAIWILRNLKQELMEEPIVLLRIIQREVFILSILKKHSMSYVFMNTFFIKYKIWKNRRLLFINVIKRLTLDKLNLIINLITNIELIINQESTCDIWYKFDILTLLLCGINFPKIFAYI